MRPEVELLAGDSAGPPAPAVALLGHRWALRLGTVLLAALALTNLARWREDAAAPPGPETVLQQPVPAEPFPAATRADTTAPDPGDTLP